MEFEYGSQSECIRIRGAFSHLRHAQLTRHVTGVAHMTQQHNSTHSPRGINGEPQNTAIALAMAVKFGVDSGAVHADGNNFISGTLSLSEAL